LTPECVNITQLAQKLKDGGRYTYKQHGDLIKNRKVTNVASGATLQMSIYYLSNDAANCCGQLIVNWKGCARSNHDLNSGNVLVFAYRD
jgi:hypothetical protein